ncbi:MAG: lipid-A-disaccharide synthase-related protein [Bacillota bacterium]
MRDRPPRVLFISNGHGEDLIASKVIEHLSAGGPPLAITALPIVGTGAVYRRMGIPLLMDGKDLPSGGFLRHGLRNLLMDLRAGLLSLTWRQIRALRRAGEETDLAVCVGDCYLLLLAGPFLRRPIVFLPTAKSDYIRPHLRVEIWLMRRFCAKIFPRDGLTAASLRAKGLPAEFMGNVMMDALGYPGFDLQATEGWTVGILPGSRRDAYLNMEDIARVVVALGETVAGRRVTYLVALAESLSFTVLAGHLLPLGWRAEAPAPGEEARGIVGRLQYGDGPGSLCLTVACGRFADILRSSDVIIGLAGTANEQAAGLGKPVVAFPGRGTQFTAGFLRAQKKLLGEAVCVVERDPEAVVQEIRAILADPQRREAMAAAGRERMGPPGGAGRIAAEIRKLLFPAL